MAATSNVTILPCPICNRQPDIDQCAPWPGPGDAPWYAVCYRASPVDHCVGVNGDTRDEAIQLWNKEAVPPARIELV